MWRSKSTNRSIGSRAPSDYIPNILVPGLAAKFQVTPAEAQERLREILRGHFIDDLAFEALVSDRYEEFIAARALAFGRFIESRFGIPYATFGTDPDPDAPIDEASDDDDLDQT